MFKENLLSWHISGLQTLKSAVDQAVTGAQKAKQAAKNEQLEVAATVLDTFLNSQSVTLGEFLVQSQPSAAVSHDAIMEGILTGMNLMVEAADGIESVDYAYLAQGRIALNYLTTAFASHAEVAEKLGLTEQSAGLKKMSFEHQEILNQYNKIIETDFWPKLI